MTIQVTFSPFTVEPRYLRAVTDAVMQAQAQFALAAWEAQIRFVEALGMAAVSAQWSMIEHLRQAQFRRD